jgi:hypothetical protein
MRCNRLSKVADRGFWGLSLLLAQTGPTADNPERALVKIPASE